MLSERLKSTPPVVARQQVTFLVLPRKVTKRNRPRFAAPAGFPALLDWSGGCGTRATRSNSPRRHPLTSLRYSAAHRGKGRCAKSASQKGNWDTFPFVAILLGQSHADGVLYQGR